VLGALLAACGGAPVAPPAAEPARGALDQDARMAWWREARFGMFVHWGLYAIPAGKWGDRTDHGEWIRDTAKIPRDVYAQFQPHWNPQRFDADAWARMAAAAGMKYVVITSKHHDGFCLWDSAQTTWDVGATPGRRDVLRELADACRAHGLRFCTYHSIMDWHHPDYLPRRPWEHDRPAAGADFARFERHLHAQVRELVRRYRPAVMWFDGEWEPTWTHDAGVRLFAHCRALAPEMLVNNRVDVHRGGMGGFSRSAEAVGDFATPEQEIPATGLPGVDWESCMTMNGHWGFNAADASWKSPSELVRNLIDVASKGGNYLLNVGPRADGTFPPEAVERLAAIGAWMGEAGEAIHGTTASPFDALPWGRVTVKANGATTTLYLHLFDPPPPTELLRLPGLLNEVRSVRFVNGKGACVPFVASVDELPAVGWQIQLTEPDPIATVLAFELDEAPDVVRAPRVIAENDTFVRPFDVAIVQPNGGVVTTCTLDGSEPTRASRTVDGPIRIADSCVLRAVSWRGDHRATSIVERSFTRVVPKPATPDAPPRRGLLAERFAVDWQAIPEDRAELVPTAREVVGSVGPLVDPGENVAWRYRGWLVVPRDDVYRFALASDDGSRLWLDGELTVDNDGLHGTVEQRGEVALARGAHTIEVVWFNRTGAAALELRWAAAGEPFAPLTPDVLRHAR
jgi:alpha-L-fucosidase